MAQYRVENTPINTTRQHLQTREGPAGNPPWEKICTLYDYQMERPLLLGGPDPDPPIVQFLKIIADVTSAGFSSRGEVNSMLAGQSDLDALAAVHGTTMENLAQSRF